ncbi:MAG: hypothetical protein RIR97_1390 [Pseudomonadota bacterium]
MTAGPSSSGQADSLATFLKRDAEQLGFDLCKITGPDAIPNVPDRLKAFLESGYHGSMRWMEETSDRRASPSVLWPDVQSIILLGMNYAPQEDPLATLAKSDSGSISVYARNRDYHDVIKGKLKTLATQFAARSGADVKVFVDTAPVMEKPLAQAAGLGWQGKHTNLVSREFGSWLFLGSIFTTAVLAHDEPETDHCGSCRACLDVCPTEAFPAPYQLDARRCISYLTIEHKGMIAREFREKIGNRIYGCDDCLAVCPWNKFANTASEMKFKPRADLIEPKLQDLLMLDDPAFRQLFSGSPVKRIGYRSFLRNCLIAAGNSKSQHLIPIIELRAQDPDPHIRAMVVWALSRLMERDAFDAYCSRLGTDTDALVREEIELAKGEICI